MAVAKYLSIFSPASKQQRQENFDVDGHVQIRQA